MTKVTVYTKNNCPACLQTKSLLDKLEITYDVKNIEEDDSNFDEVLKLGFKQVPVVIAGANSWSGHNAYMIMQIELNEK